MNQRTKLIAAGVLCVVLLAVGAYLWMPSGPAAADAADDARRLEAAQAVTEGAKASAPPPIKFMDLPAEMPQSGRRTPAGK